MSNINEIIKINEELRKQFLNAKTLMNTDLLDDSFNVNQKIGIAWTNNNRKYFAIGKLESINDKTARIKLGDLNSYGNDGIGLKFTVKIVKPTDFNRLFLTEDNLNELVKGLIETEDIINKYVEGKISEFWKDKIAKINTL